MSASSLFGLTLFGNPVLTTPGGVPLTGRAAQRHRLALLALLARSPGNGVGREALMAYLWPERHPEQARNLLKVSVYVLRQAVGDSSIRSSGDRLHLSTRAVRVDVLDFEAALARGDHRGAVALYQGPFLDGFFLKDASEFGYWTDRERGRLAEAYGNAVESLAEQAETARRLPEAVEWWKIRAGHDPYDSRVALRLMRALAANGSPAGAFRHARIHEQLIRSELGLEPSAEVLAAVERLRRESGGPPVGIVPEPLADESASVTREPDPSTTPGPSSRAPSAIRLRLPRVWVRRTVFAGAPIVLALAIWSVDRQGSRGSRDTSPGPASVRAWGGEPVAAFPSPPGTSSVVAWDLYRRASQPEVVRSDSAARQALGLLQQAVELDPSFAAAHAGLARLELRVAPPEDPRMPRVERLALATWHASRAVELDSFSVEAHATLGIAEMLSYDLASAETHLGRALELDPGMSRTREWLVQLFVLERRFPDALEQAERAVEVDPLSPSVRAELARALLVNGRCEEALVQLEPLVHLQPPLLRAGPIAAQCHAREGAWDEAVSDVSAGVEGAGDHGKATLAYFLARSGRRDEARTLLEELTDAWRHTHGDAFWVATVHAGLGDLDAAFEWLERSVSDYSLTYEVQEPRFADLQADARFAPLLRRLGPPSYE